MDTNETAAAWPPQPPPPPASPPPIIVPPAPPPPSRRGRGWMIFALVLVGLLLMSVLLNFTQFASNLVSVKGVYTRSGGPRLEETVLEDNNGTAKIAVIDVDGIIASSTDDSGSFGMVEVVRAQLDRAREDRRVKAVVLRVDSPGGEVLASDDLYRAISDFQTKSSKPVIASMGSLAASGGYYVSSASRWIVANELTSPAASE